MTLQNITQRNRYSCSQGHWWSDRSGLHNLREISTFVPVDSHCSKGEGTMASKQKGRESKINFLVSQRFVNLLA